MADNVVDVVIRARDETSAGTSSAKQGVGTLESMFGELGATADAAAGLAATGLAAVAAGAVAAGVGAFALGNEFHDAYNTIRVGTGATGDALQGLENDFKQVVRDVPADFGDAADAVTKLHDQLGLTGPPLDALSEQFLNLSRITHTDLNQDITDSTQIMKQWNVSAQDQSGILDMLFTVVQATGIGYNQLASEVSANGLKMKALGFDVYDTTYFMGALYKAGIDVSSVMPGFSKAIQTASKEGKDAHTVLEDTFNSIRNAKTPIEATSIAMETFGKRAGGPMADAIRSGKLGLEDMINSLHVGEDTINQAAADTLGLGDKVKLLANNLKVDLEPVATAVFDDVLKGVDKLQPAFTTASDAVKVFYSAWTGQGVNIGDELGNWSATIATFGNNARDTFDLVSAKINEIAATPAWNSFVGTLQTGLNWLKANGPSILEGLKSAFDDVKGAIQPLLDYMDSHSEVFTRYAQYLGILAAVLVGVAAAVPVAMASIALFIGSLIALAAIIVGTVLSALYTFGQVLWDVFNNVKTAVGTAIGFVVGIITGLPGQVAGVFSAVVSFFAGLPGQILGALAALPGLLMSFFGAAFNAVTFAIGYAIGTIVRLVIGLVVGIVSAVVALPGILGNIFTSAWNLATSIVSSLVDDVVNFFTSLPGRAASAISSLWSSLTGSFDSAKTGAETSTTSLVDTVINFLTSLPGRAVSALAAFPGDVADALRAAVGDAASIGSDIVQGVANGITSGVGFVVDAAKKAAGNIINGFKSALGIGSPSRVAAELVGDPVAQGIGVGISDGLPHIANAIGGVVQTAMSDASGSFFLSAAEADQYQAGEIPASYWGHYNGPRDAGFISALSELQRAVAAGTFQGPSLDQPGVAMSSNYWAHERDIDQYLGTREGWHVGQYLKDALAEDVVNLSSQGGYVNVKFSGNIDSALANVIMNLVRAGQIQISSTGIV